MPSAQVLLTFFDMSARTHYLNARHTLRKLLDWRVVPVINENDTTTTDEISFGDNDFLAAQVAILLGADRLVLLTDTGGLYSADPRQRPRRRLDRRGARAVEELEGYDIGVSTSPLGSGGMRSKVVAAEMATAAGIPVTIASGVEPRRWPRALAGEPAGTRFHPQRRARVELQAVAEVREADARGGWWSTRAPSGPCASAARACCPWASSTWRASSRPATRWRSRCDGRAVGKGIVNYSAAELRRDQGAEDRRRARADAARHRGGRAPRLLRARVRHRCAWRSPYDREILKLAAARAGGAGGRAALPAGGHRDGGPPGHRRSWRRWRSPRTLMAGAFTLFNFLTYGTTAQVARFHGAGEEVAAGRLAAQALWLSDRHRPGPHRAARRAGRAAGGPDGRRRAHRRAGRRCTCASARSALPFALIALAGQGYLRGVSDLRTPLVIVVVANVVNVVLNVLFIYGFGWGLAGSALGDGGGAGRAWGPPSCGALLRRAGRHAPPSLAADAPAGADRRRDLRAHRGPRTARSWWRARCSRASGTDSLRRPPDRLPAVRVPGAGARLRSRSRAR